MLGKTFMDETNIKYINKIRPFFRCSLSIAKENKNTKQNKKQVVNFLFGIQYVPRNKIHLPQFKCGVAVFVFDANKRRFGRNRKKYDIFGNEIKRLNYKLKI